MCLSFLAQVFCVSCSLRKVFICLLGLSFIVFLCVFSMFLSVFHQRIFCHDTPVIYIFWWAPSQTYSWNNALPHLLCFCSKACIITCYWIPPTWWVSVSCGHICVLLFPSSCVCGRVLCHYVAFPCFIACFLASVFVCLLLSVFSTPYCLQVSLLSECVVLSLSVASLSPYRFVHVLPFLYLCC